MTPNEAARVRTLVAAGANASEIATSLGLDVAKVRALVEQDAAPVRVTLPPLARSVPEPATASARPSSPRHDPGLYDHRSGVVVHEHCVSLGQPMMRKVWW